MNFRLKKFKLSDKLLSSVKILYPNILLCIVWLNEKLCFSCFLEFHLPEESSGLTSTLSSNGSITSVPSGNGSHFSNRNDGMTKEAEGDSLVSQKNEATLKRPKYRFSLLSFFFNPCCYVLSY